MGKLIPVVVVAAIAAAGAWYAGLFGGGMSAEDRAAAFQTLLDEHIEASGLEIDDVASFRTINVSRDGNPRFVVHVDAEAAGDEAAEIARVVEFTCANETVRPAIDGGAEVTLQIVNIGETEPFSESVINAASCG